MNQLFVSVTGLLFFCSAGCGPGKPAAHSSGNGEGLSGQEWHLLELEGTPVEKQSGAMLVFAAGDTNRVSGHTGCNRLMGSFSTNGKDKIRFSPLATTEMACLDQSKAKTEKAFLHALADVDQWQIVNSVLLLQSGKKTVAKLSGSDREEVAGAGEAALNGTWELNYISGPRIAFEGLYPAKKPTLVFHLPDSVASGSGSCNTFRTKVKINGNGILFGDVASTRMACPGTGESVFFKTLATITAFDVTDGRTLTLIAGDIAMMRFDKKF